MMMMVSLSWVISKSQAQCPDTSYFYIKVTPNNTGCATLCDLNTFKVVIFYPTTPTPTIIRFQYWSNSQADYYFCVKGPVSMNICATMQQVGPCKGYTNFTSNYDCTSLSFPAYASTYSQPIPLSFNYCLYWLPFKDYANNFDHPVRLYKLAGWFLLWLEKYYLWLFSTIRVWIFLDNN
jgi:hypothetical protein